MKHTFSYLPDPDNKYDICEINIVLNDKDATATKLAQVFARYLLAVGYTEDTVESLFSDKVEIL